MKNEQKFDVNNYLNQVLKKRDTNLGMGGDYKFVLATEVTDTKMMTLLVVPNLTEIAARNLFDLIDENNSIVKDRDGGCFIFGIYIYKGNTLIDENRIPNAFTDFIEYKAKA